MGLETAQYINGLTASWPTGGEPKSQGDDHLRLIKGAVQRTFPNANAEFYFPRGEVVSVNATLDVTDQNNVLIVGTGSGDVQITLPSGLTVAQAGWEVGIMKNSTDSNGVRVIPATGVIFTRVGATSSVRVGQYCVTAKFVWGGVGWVCVKPGPIVGQTVSYDGPTLPNGFLPLNGAGFDTSKFAELFAALGTGTLRSAGAVSGSMQIICAC